MNHKLKVIEGKKQKGMTFFYKGKISGLKKAIDEAIETREKSGIENIYFIQKGEKA